MVPMNRQRNSTLDRTFWRNKILSKNGRLKVSSAGCNTVPKHVADHLVETYPDEFKVEVQARAKTGWRKKLMEGETSFYLILLEKE